MSDRSYVAARLWGKIIGQIPKACTGEYPEQPSNVIQQYGEYFTEGTETGLTVYKSPERLRQEAEERERREAEERAEREAEQLRELQAKWDREREAHKVWVIDRPGYWQKGKHHDAVYPIIGYEQIDTGEVDEDGKPIYKDGAPIYGDTPTTPAYDDPDVWIDEVGHWEYQPGWRDGDRPTSL